MKGWLLKLAKAVGPALAQQAWPRVKAAGKAAWTALRTSPSASPNAEPPREDAPEVAVEEGEYVPEVSRDE